MKRAWIFALFVAPACAGAPPPPAPPPPPESAPLAVTAPPPATAAPTAAPEAPPAEPPPPPPKPPEPPKPSITSVGYFTWVFGRPKADKRFIGIIRYGTKVTLRSTERVKGEGCPGGFYQVEPRGFVCNNRTVTEAPSKLFVEQAAASSAVKGPFPYRYAMSNGAPMYNRVPNGKEQTRHEGPLGPPGKHLTLPKSLAAHEELAVEGPIPAADALPSFLAGKGTAAEGRKGLLRETIPLGSMLSFTKAFAAEGRTWLLSADQTLVPADRTRLFRPSSFHGVPLAGELHLPLAWIRKGPKPQYRRLPSGEMERTERAWPLRAHVALKGTKVEVKGISYWETNALDPSGAALFIADRDATVAEAVRRYPTGVKEGQKFIVVSITQGTLVAYEGLHPVYATLMSPGAGGVPVKGRNPVKDSTTPLGTYNVTFKDRATTMSPEQGEHRTFWIADVPHTQYFNPPFALHAAYWHDRFGEPTSAGCVNVSPIDAEWLFGWSDPQVPDEWQGATGAGAPENGATTAIVVRR